MAFSGIQSILLLSAEKSSQADADALDGANNARDLIAEQKRVRDRKRAFEDDVRDNVVTFDEYYDNQRMLDEVGIESDGAVGGSNDWDGYLGSGDGTSWKAETGNVDDETQAHNQEVTETIRRRYEDKLSDLENQDKMTNFEVQDLMSRFTEAQNMMSSVQKKKDELDAGQIQKIG